MAHPQSYERYHRLKRFHFSIQALLVIVLMVGLNYCASQYYWRLPISSQYSTTLSAETVARLDQMEPREPIKITVSLTPRSQESYQEELFRYVDRLLKEYAHYANHGRGKKIELRLIHPFKDRREFESLKNEYGMDGTQWVLLEYGNEYRVLEERDLAVVQEGELMALRSEQSITKAMISLTQLGTKRIYFTVGHGEMLLDGLSPLRGLSELRQILELRNFELRSIDLAEFEDVPEDADLIVVAGPLGPFNNEDAEKLRRYLDQAAGRLLLFLNPGIEHGLDNLLQEWGLRTEDMVLIEKGEETLSLSGDLRIRRFAPHPITDTLIANELVVSASLLRPVSEDFNRPVDERLKIYPLMLSSPESWAERAWRNRSSPSFDERTDFKGPLVLAVAAERNASPFLGLEVLGGRLTVLGSSDLIANHQMAQVGNQYLIIHTIDWNIDKGSLLGLAPEPLERFQLSLSAQKQWKIAFAFLSVPLVVLLAGALVSLIRYR